MTLPKNPLPEFAPSVPPAPGAAKAAGAELGTNTGLPAGSNDSDQSKIENPKSRISLASLPQAEPLLLPELVAHRARLAQHRATAFIRYAPTVAGFRLNPVTLRTRDRLAAFECDLGRGTFEDLAIFVWVHHPAFGQFAWFRRWLVVTWLSWKLSDPANEAVAFAAARRLLARASLDWPASDDSASADPLPCSFAAYVLNLVKGRHPQLTADEILDWPLVELVQWLRAIIAERDPKNPLMDWQEASILAEALAPAASTSAAPASSPANNPS